MSDAQDDIDAKDGIDTLTRLEGLLNGHPVAPLSAEQSLTSIAVSLKRIADHLTMHGNTFTVTIRDPVTVKTPQY